MKRDVSMDAGKVVEKTLSDNPEIRLVLEIAARTRDAESKELPRTINIPTEVTAIPTNSQRPV